MTSETHNRSGETGLLGQFTHEELDLLQLIVDTVIPEDEWPGGWSGGVAQLLRNPVGSMDELVEPLRAAVGRVDAAARRDHGKPFVELTNSQRLEVVEAEYVVDGGSSAAGTTRTVARLVTTAFEGFYSGRTEPAGWAMVGYRPLPDGVVPVDGNDLPGISVKDLLPAYDVIVMGAGAGGGVAACELAEAGHQVLLVERARPMRDSELRDNHVQGKRNQLYGVTAGPGVGNPRVLEKADGTSELLRGDGDMLLLASFIFQATLPTSSRPIRLTP